MKVVNWNLLYPEEDNKKKTPRYYFKKSYDDDLKQLNKVLKSLTPSSKKKKYSEIFSTVPHKFVGGYGISDDDRMQHCTVKMRYSETKASHRKFLSHYMTQEGKKDVKEKPKLFGNDSLENYEKRMVSKHFKFILSPENSNVPLKEFAHCYMDAISKLLNKKFDWQAVVHTNTEHPHLHILINGKTLDGKKLNRPFSKNFSKNLSRKIAREITTKIMGERQIEEIILGKEKSVYSLRFTKLDNKIEELLEENNSLKINNNSLPLRIQKRLSFLTENKIISYKNNLYNFPKNWKEDLEIVGKYNTYLQARESLKFTMPKNFSLFDNPDEKISGTLRKVYCMNDEDIWTNALVIENKDLKKAWYVPLYDSTERYIEKIGCEISFEKKLLKNGKYKNFINIEDKDEEIILVSKTDNKKTKSLGLSKHKEVINEK